MKSFSKLRVARFLNFKKVFISLFSIPAADTETIISYMSFVVCLTFLSCPFSSASLLLSLSFLSLSKSVTSTHPKYTKTVTGHQIVKTQKS